MLFKLNGLVLKQRNIGENDRILVLLTKEKECWRSVPEG